MNRRTVILGIDGAPFQLMDELSNKGVMPNFQGLKKTGDFKKMRSSVPAVSATAWSSIITGKNPGEHGVYGFTDMIEGTYTLSFHNLNKLKAPAFWQKGDGRYVILNVPSTYPAREINGCHVAGFVAPDFEKAIYPNSLNQNLKQRGYKIDIDSEKAQKSERLLFKELFETLEKRIEAYRYLRGKYDWDVFKVVFTGSDRLEHFLWKEWRKDERPKGKFLKFFKEIDKVIGEVNDRLGEEDSLVILSDHGMEGVKKNVNLNAWLEEKGFLKLGEGKKYNKLKEGSKAFALEHGRIYLNKKGRYPRGSVGKDEEERVIEELVGSFRELRKNGGEVINKIYRRDEIYSGEQVKSAPDLVLISNEGYNLRGKMSPKIFEKSELQGMHNQNAFLFAKKKDLPNEPKLEDVYTLINGKKAT